MKIFRPILQIYKKIMMAFSREQENAVPVIVKQIAAINRRKPDYSGYFGTPEGIRTPDTRLRRAVLCPAELLARMQFLFVSVTPAGERPPNARRRPLYPTELRGLIQGSFCLTGFDQAVSPACLVVYRAGPAGQGGSRSLLLHPYSRRRVSFQTENHAPPSGFPATNSR